MRSRINFTVFLLIFTVVSGVYGQDVIYTMEGEKIKANVAVIGTDKVTYKKYQSDKDVKRTFPLTKVYMIRYENGEEEIFASPKPEMSNDADYKPANRTPDSGSQPGNVSKVNGKPIKKLSEEEKCAMGKEDAKKYHGKTGAHLLYGLLFGPFATLGAAISSPSPQSGSKTITQSEHSELFEDPAYLGCYEQEAKGDNVSATLFGWLPLIAVLFVL